MANLTEGASAHQTLQSLYRNADLPGSLRAKCAAASLPHETPRLESVPPPLELTAVPYEPLSVVVQRQRARLDKLLALPLSERERLVRGVAHDGNGNDEQGG